MTHLAIITGLSGREAYLAREGETVAEANARRFRCERSALDACRKYVATLPPVVARHMAYRAEVRP